MSIPLGIVVDLQPITNALFDFFIIALSVFVFIKLINNAKDKFTKKEEIEEVIEEAKPSETELLLTEIRDILKNK